MPIKYKIDVLETLKANGYSSYKLRQEKIFGQAVIQQFRNGEIVSTACLEKLCVLLNCQPGDILAYTSDENIHQN